MRFTAGNLNLYTVLVIIYLFPVIAKPPCNLLSLAEKEKHDIAHILKQYTRLNGEHLTPMALNFSQLHIHSGPSEEKKLSAVCGVNYTIYALQLIYKHQQQLNPEKPHFLKDLSNTIRSLEETLKLCLENILSVSCKKHAKPEFPDKKDHFTRKQWSLAALQHIEKFFDELIKFLKKTQSQLE